MAESLEAIFIDMDEVLTDFVAGVCRLYRLDPDRVKQQWPLGVWHTRDGLEKFGLTVPEDEMHEEINNRSPFFWESLDVHPWLEELIALIESYTKNWFVLTSPMNSPYCYAGKVIWLQRVFGNDFNRVIPTKYKYLLAKPGRVLIDDSDKHIEAFTEHGGHGILFPSRYGSLHDRMDDPLLYVREQLDIYARIRQ